MYYDPMIAKLCTRGPDRETAIQRMQAALDAYYIRGINHNMAFLADVMAKDRFRSGELSTNFIDEEYPDGFLGAQPTETVKRRVIVTAAILQRASAAREAQIAGQISGHGAHVGDDWEVFVEDDRVPVTVSDGGPGLWRVATPDGEVEVETDWQHGDPLFHARISGQPITVQVDRAGARWRLTHGGASVEARVLRPHAAKLAALMPKKEPPDLSRYLLSPMPGLLVKLMVEEGTPVKAGEELAVVEAMKMENVLRAERDGTVAKIHAQSGANLSVDQAILEFE
jgi:propionyl-CoA carboxylase alpha chain